MPPVYILCGCEWLAYASIVTCTACQAAFNHGIRPAYVSQSHCSFICRRCMTSTAIRRVHGLAHQGNASRVVVARLFEHQLPDCCLGQLLLLELKLERPRRKWFCRRIMQLRQPWVLQSLHHVAAFAAEVDVGRRCDIRIRLRTYRERTSVAEQNTCVENLKKPCVDILRY